MMSRREKGWPWSVPLANNKKHWASLMVVHQLLGFASLHSAHIKQQHCQSKQPSRLSHHVWFWWLTSKDSSIKKICLIDGADQFPCLVCTRTQCISQFVPLSFHMQIACLAKCFCVSQAMFVLPTSRLVPSLVHKDLVVAYLRVHTRCSVPVHTCDGSYNLWALT